MMCKPFRILHVVGSMDRGGTETMIMNLYRNIDRTKVQFDFIVHTTKKCDYDDEIRSLGGKIYTIPRFKGLNIIEYLYNWSRFFKSNGDYKVVHGHIGSCAALYLYMANKYGCFTIAHSHGVNGSGIKNFIYNLFSYPTRYIAKYFFACSKEAGIDRFGRNVVNSSLFKVLNNAIDAKKFSFDSEVRRIKRENMDINDNFVIGHIGRFDANKNHNFIVDVFKDIHDKYNNSKLILIGDGKLKRAVDEKVIQLGLSDSVICTGVQADISDFLQVMDVFLFPSKCEGLGIVAIEAQAAGLKTICSDVIPLESKITENIHYLSLDKSSKEWADYILKFKDGYIRNNMYKFIVDSGYDIEYVSTWIKDFYLSLK